MRAIITPIVCALATMSAAATPLPTHAAARSEAPLRNAERYREAVTPLYDLLNYPCRLHSAVDNASITAPAQAVADQYRREIARSRYAPLYDQAMADRRRARALVVVRCNPPHHGPVANLRIRWANDTRAAVATLRAMSNTPR
jgi:hypothetical protein